MSCDFLSHLVDVEEKLNFQNDISLSLSRDC